ncbi:hypothetical protein LTS18_008667 [Coniosporium uncinatum]|uniref:Uncharacterized protein n=1 Tax=Coniosporium uncinatum TaxID=93489 RepID=A0ACC3DXH0_9PEZI|nr:hypothetical protein LTS18_008667 [Coniosporium uncinatum]
MDDTLVAMLLFTTIHHTAQWGDSNDGGVRRLTLTDEDKEVRGWLAENVKELGCTLKVDEVGTMFAIRPGSDNSLPPIAMGSHLDTQPAGGKFDGILGVLGGLEVLSVLKENSVKTRNPIAVVNWTNEEGTRFNSGMLGSSVWAGDIGMEEAYGLKDVDGKTFRGELERIGYLGTVGANHKKNALGAHIQLHIEQGPVLEETGKALGVVTGVQAMGWLYVTVNGRCQHCGTTPMDRRSDALLAASKMIAKINEMVLKLEGMSTVGIISSERPSPGTIPGKVRFSVDLEHLDDDSRALMVERAKKICSLIGELKNGKIDIEDTWTSRRVRFNPLCIDTVREAATALVGEDGYAELPAGTGHDSVNTSYHCPTSMIFIPSQNGISHHPSERTNQDQW